MELTINKKTGLPVIEFRHYENESNLEEKLISVFVNKAVENGLKLLATGGTVGGLIQYSTYEIRPKDPDRVRVPLNTREVPKFPDGGIVPIEQKIHERIEQLERDIITADAVGAIIDQRSHRNTIIELKDLLSK